MNSSIRRSCLIAFIGLVLSRGADAEVIVVPTAEFTPLNVALSPDGSTVVVNLKPGHLMFADAKTGADRVVRANIGRWQWLAFTPDSRRVISGDSFDGQVRIWDALSGELQTELGNHSNACRSVAVSRDGKRFATGGHAPNVHAPAEIILWDAEKLKELRRIPTARRVNSLVFSADGGWLAAALDADWSKPSDPMSEVQIVETNTGKLMQRLPIRYGGGFILALSPDGTRLAIGEENGTSVMTSLHQVRLVDVDTWRDVATLRGHTRAITGLVFAHDGRTLWSSSTDGTLIEWNVPEQKRVRTTILNAFGVPYSQLSMSDDGSRLAMIRQQYLGKGEAKEQVELQAPAELPDDTQTLDDKWYRVIGPRTIQQLRFSADGRVLAADRLGYLMYWDATTGQDLPPINYSEFLRRSISGFSPQLDQVLVGGNMLSFWDVATRSYARDIPGSGVKTTGGSLSKDAAWLAQCRADLRLQVRSTTSEFVAAESPVLPVALASSSFSPDGEFVVTADRSKAAKITVWQLPAPPGKLGNLKATGQLREVSSFEFKEDAIRYVIASPQAKYVIAVGKNRKIRGWTQDGKQAWFLTGSAAAFHPDGERFAIACPTKFPRIFEIRQASNGKWIQSVSTNHLKEIRALAFSPEGSRLATGSSDGTVTLWNLATGKIDLSPFQFERP